LPQERDSHIYSAAYNSKAFNTTHISISKRADKQEVWCGMEVNVAMETGETQLCTSMWEELMNVRWHEESKWQQDPFR
jgi:hypothetical protein